ncbi:MAG: SufB/SufD family protein [Acidimicrobiales bacterium]
MAARRNAALEAFAAAPLPSAKEEVWRYSRIDDLDLDRFGPIVPLDGADRPAPGPFRDLLEAFGAWSVVAVSVDGVLATFEPATGTGVTVLVGPLAEHPDAERLLGAVADPGADLVGLNDACMLDPLVVDVPAGARLERPVVVLHVVSDAGGSAVFPRTVVRVGDGAEASVVEAVISEGAARQLLLPGRAGPGGGPVVEGGDETATTSAPRSDVPTVVRQLVVPVTELTVGDGASLGYVSVQALASDVWSLASQVSSLGEGASLSSFAVAAGAGYGRLRTDSVLAGAGGSSRLRAAFVGTGDQMLDFRTMQDHAAPRTTSDLLFKGVLSGHAHSVYSGLIRIRRGAVRSDARQTNHNLVLDEGAHADSVPNLDIEENDVRCSHASTVGPVDEDQRYYLESRGIDPERAEELIVAGFFDDIADQVPVTGVDALVSRVLGRRLVETDHAEVLDG